MRAPLSWLREYVAFDLAPDALAEALTLRGLEVSAVEVSGADWADVVVGRLLSIERHPNADKLWLTTVDVGSGTPLQVVCGADNISVGQLVPVALVGSVLSGGRRIERSKIRGVESQGMLCSAIELGLGEDAEGIHILGNGDEHPIGADLRQLLGEVVLDVDVKPNRGDALSMVGLAREVAALVGGSVQMPETSVSEDPGLQVADQVRVTIEEPAGCPRFTARGFTDVRNGASPGWMQRRLLAAGMRPISAVVDVTNYVMHELGQPMHAYDADAVPEGRIVVRRARDGERLETIDHEQRTLDGRMLVIADAQNAIGLAGIMGGAGTEVTAATTRVILESAIFHGPSVRNTARRLGLRSEASMRHEKGIGHHLPRVAVDRAARLIAETTGAKVATGIADNDPQPRPRRVVTLEVARTERLLGLPLDGGQVAELLAPLGFQVEAAGGDGLLAVSVPEHRLDVLAPEDVAEEIARSHGYGGIPARQPQPALPPFRPDPSEPRHRVRRVLAGLGLDEVLTHALMGPQDLRRSGYDPTEASVVRVANPLAEAHSLLRPSMAPSMLASLAENVRQRRLDPWLFEIGKTYWMGGAKGPGWADTAGTGRYEAWHVGIALLGPVASRSPGSEPHDADVGDLKGVVEALHAALGAPVPTFTAESEHRHPYLHTGRAARIMDASGHAYGNLGEAAPRVASAWDLPGRPVIAVINLPQLVALIPPTVRAAVVPPAQPLDRDIAVVVDAATPVGEVMRIIRANAGELLVASRLFDEYRGPQVGDGKVSYAVSLRFQPEAAGDERGVERSMNRIRGALQHHLEAQIR